MPQITDYRVTLLVGVVIMRVMIMAGMGRHSAQGDVVTRVHDQQPLGIRKSDEPRAVFKRNTDARVRRGARYAADLRI